MKTGAKGVNSLMALWEPSLFKTIKELQPDIVVCDFVTGMLGVLAADEMGIPSVINAPAPIGHMKKD